MHPLHPAAMCIVCAITALGRPGRPGRLEAGILLFNRTYLSRVILHVYNSVYNITM